MQRAAFFAVFALCAVSGRASVLDALSRSDVRVSTHLREIDSSAVGALTRQFHDRDRRLADHGAPFEATDALGPENHPQRRLVLATHVGDTWFIHYEHGGFGYHSHLVALTRVGNSWRVEYTAAAFHVYDSLAKLRAAIRGHQFQKTYEL